MSTYTHNDLGTFDLNPAGGITNPGRFEGEIPATVHFYALSMDGCAVESGEDWDAFKIEPEDLALDIGLVPEDVGRRYVVMISEQGFISGEVMDDEEFAQFGDQASEEAESEDEDEQD